MSPCATPISGSVQLESSGVVPLALLSLVGGWWRVLVISFPCHPRRYPEPLHMELRRGFDGHAYSRAEFMQGYGPGWEAVWQAAPIVTSVTGEKRIARDGVPYSVEDFMAYYGHDWQEHWVKSPSASARELCSSGVALAPLDGVDAGAIQPGAAGAAQPGAGGAPPDNKIDAGALQPGAAGAAQPGAGGAHSAAAVAVAAASEWHMPEASSTKCAGATQPGAGAADTAAATPMAKAVNTSGALPAAPPARPPSPGPAPLAARLMLAEVPQHGGGGGRWADSNFILQVLPRNHENFQRVVGRRRQWSKARDLVNAAYGELYDHLPLLARHFTSFDLAEELHEKDAIIVIERVTRVSDSNRPGHDRVDFFCYKANGDVWRYHTGRTQSSSMTPHCLPAGSPLFRDALAREEGVGRALYAQPPGLIRSSLGAVQPETSSLGAVQPESCAAVAPPPFLCTREDLAMVCPYDAKMVNWNFVRALLQESPDHDHRSDLADGVACLRVMQTCLGSSDVAAPRILLRL